jgi:hypothetical protein
MKVVLRSFLGMRYLTGQLIHQVFFALARIAGFQRIVVTHFNVLRFSGDGIDAPLA